MSDEGATTTSYADLRRKRSDRPTGGNFLSAKTLKANDIDVTVTAVSVRKGYQKPGSSEPVPDDPYWSIESTDLKLEAGQPAWLVKENAFMSDWLDENGIDDPTGKSFRLIKSEHKGNPTFKIARLL